MKWTNTKQRLQDRLDKQTKTKTEWMLRGWEYKVINETIFDK